MSDYAFSPDELADPLHDPKLPRRFPSVVPNSVERADLMEALEPLFSLLGLPKDEGPQRVYVSPGLSVEDDTVTITLAGHVVTDATARTVKVGKDDEYAEWATEVKIRVR